MKNENLLTQMEVALREITTDLGMSCLNTSFFLSPLYQVHVTSESGTTLMKIFGASKTKRVIKYARNLFKFKSSINITFNLPKDSVLFIKPQRQRLIAVSKEQDLVLKVAFEEAHFELLRMEAHRLSSFKNTPMEKYAPRLIKEGMTKNGAMWIATSFCDNSESFQFHVRPDLYLLKNFEALVFPVLRNYYEIANSQSVNLEAWLDEARARIKAHPARETLERFHAAILENFLNLEENLTIADLHFDLHAGNILFDGKNISIIDWEVSHRGLIFVDYFDFYRRVVNKSSFEKRKFFNFLRHDMAPPEKLQSFHNLFSKSPVKLHIMLYALERTLIYFEKWGANRVTSKGSFEGRIIEEVLSRKL